MGDGAPGAAPAAVLADIGQPFYVLQSGGTVRDFDNFTSGIDRPRDYTLSGLAVETSSSGRHPPDRPGTRVLLFDGTITQLGAAFRIDGANGVALPGLNGTLGSINNGTVGFTAVGTGFELAGGTVTGVNGSTVNPVVPGAGGVLSGQVDRTLNDTQADRAASDTTMSGAESTTATGEAPLAQRPAALADLGRGGGVPGPAANAFGREYPLATSNDGSVCARGAVLTAERQGGRRCGPR
jgi:hypothetical protein